MCGICVERCTGIGSTHTFQGWNEWNGIVPSINQLHFQMTFSRSIAPTENKSRLIIQILWHCDAIACMFGIQLLQKVRIEIKKAQQLNLRAQVDLRSYFTRIRVYLGRCSVYANRQLYATGIRFRVNYRKINDMLSSFCSSRFIIQNLYDFRRDNFFLWLFPLIAASKSTFNIQYGSFSLWNV